MSQLKTRRPSPALVVAVFALLVALGGTGYAASQLPENSVGTAQLQRGAVVKAKLDKNAVTSAKVKPDSLRGADVEESTLAQVPNAHKADVATSADAAKSADNAKSADAAKTAANAASLQGHGPGDFVPTDAFQQISVSMQAGEEKEIVRNGPVSIYARCLAVTVGTTERIELRMFARTDVDGAILITYHGDMLNGTGDRGLLDVGTPEAAREWNNTADNIQSRPREESAYADDGESLITYEYPVGMLVAPTGEAIVWESGDQILALNYLGAPCVVGGNIHLSDLR